MTSKLLIGLCGSGPRSWDVVGWFGDVMFNIPAFSKQFGFDFWCPEPKHPSPIGRAWPVDGRLDDEFLQKCAEFDEVHVLGYSSGAACGLGFAMRNPGRVASVASFMGFMMAEDTYMAAAVSPTRYLFVQGEEDRAINQKGGFVPVGRNAHQGEGYLGARQAVRLLAGTERDAVQRTRIDLIDATEDGLPDIVKPGEDTTVETWSSGDELWTIDGYRHADYVGRACARRIYEWMFGQ